MSWMLVDLRDDYETRELPNGDLEKRNHVTIVIRKQQTGGVFISKAGNSAGSVSYRVGSVTSTKVLGGSKRFICSSDGLRPEGHPLDKASREQVWEYFSPWTEETFGNA